jgi:hypothetical protein
MSDPYVVGSFVLVSEKSVTKIDLQYGDMAWRVCRIYPNLGDQMFVECELVCGTGPMALPGRKVSESKEEFDSKFKSREYKIAPGSQIKSLLRRMATPSTKSSQVCEIPDI